MNPELRENGYIPAKGLLEPSLARVIYKTLLLQQWRGECFRDNHIPTAASVSNTALTDALLLELRPKIEAISGCRLVPTYSYARVYFHGDTMIRHQDRGSCEVSVSIHLGRDGGDASLWFQPNTKVEMEEGDGAVYLGTRRSTGGSASRGTRWGRFSFTTSWRRAFRRALLRRPPRAVSAVDLGRTHLELASSCPVYVRLARSPPSWRCALVRNGAAIA